MLGEYSPVFYLNDDVTMRSIMSGAYTGTPDAHAVYMKYPLTYLLSLCYRLTDVVPWLEIFFYACTALCGWTLLYGIKAKKWNEKLLLIMLTVFACVPLCFYMHYTIIAALLAACGIWAYLLEQPKWQTVACFVLAYAVRGQVFYVALPFLMVAALWKGRRYFLVRIKSILWIVSIVMVIALCHYMGYAGEWSTYRTFNDVRTELYDYTDFLSTNEYCKNPEVYGMTPLQGNVLNSYNLLLDDTIDTEFLAGVERKVVARMTEGRTLSKYFKMCIKSYYNYIRYDTMWEHMVLAVAYALLLMYACVSKQWKKIVLLFALGGGRSVIWLYLIWQGRFPQRVQETLLLVELLLVCGCLLMEEASEKHKKIRSAILICALVLLVGITGNKKLENVKAVNDVQKQWDVLVEYCENHSEQTFLLDVFSVVAYSGRAFEKDASNMCMLGGWLAGSPIAIEKIAGASGPCLIVREDREYLWMEESFRKKYGAGAFTPTPVEIKIDKTVFLVVEYEQAP